MNEYVGDLAEKNVGKCVKLIVDSGTLFALNFAASVSR